ncbi:unnamed protein product, partial [marine sediment metagenome]
PLGERFWPFLSPEVDLAQICTEFGITLLGEIPLTPDRKVVEQVFNRIASRLEGAKPIILQDDIAKRLLRKGKRKLLKVAVRRL